MTEVILGQLRFILWMMCGGMAILAGYDVLRLFRWLVPHGAVWIAVEDLFFWGAASVPAFILFLKMHDGQIRWYGVVALLSGSCCMRSALAGRSAVCFVGSSHRYEQNCGVVVLQYFANGRESGLYYIQKLRSTVAFSGRNPRKTGENSSKSSQKFYEITIFFVQIML